MACKDRLEELQKLNNDRDESKIVVDDDKKAKHIRQTAEVADKVNKLIENIRNNTTHANNILKNNVFKIPTDLSEELDRLFKENEHLSFKINKLLIEIKNEINNGKSASVEKRIKKIQYDRLTLEFKNALTESTACLEYHQKERQEIYENSIKAVNKNIPIEEQTHLLQEEQTQVFIDDYFSQTNEAKRQLADIHERHTALLKIEKHLVEVRELFIRTAVLVEQQQESIDIVSFYANSATDYVETGARDLSKSAKKKNRLFQRKVYFMIILIIILAVLIALMFVLK